ncbi:MAG TPA: RNA 3'-terminal phosphate cyclase [Myxococcales bacterium]|jgi:RNA 3'-terminal phosphate cyclase
MPETLSVERGAPAAVLDGALGLALAATAPLRIEGPLEGADLEMAQAAAQIAGIPEAVAALASPGAHELSLPQPRAGLHALDFASAEAGARALWTFSWPLALLGKPSELRLRGPNHEGGAPTFHDLRFAWAQLAAHFGLKLSLSLTAAGFDEPGEIVALLDPAPALLPIQAMHRGILRQVNVVAAVAGGRSDAALEAASEVVKGLRRRGLVAESERVPLPLAPSAQARSRWALTATAEFETSVVSVSEVGQWNRLGDAQAVGERVAQRLQDFLERRGAVDARMAERLLLPSFLCAAGLGARAGAAPSCHYSTSEITSGLLQLATLARLALPVRAIVDGAEGEAGVVVVAPAT